MFGWVDFKEDGKEKKKVENRRENEWKGYLVEGGGGRKKSGGAQLFSLRTHQNSISLKRRENEENVCWTKLPFSIQ